jgi:hypothetical protein
MSYAFINQSVGKNGKNGKQDVMSIQIRLNRWIMEGKLPSVPMLAVDGGCGGQTRTAIGAFQKLYLGMNNPDCRVDPGGKTLDALFQSLIPPQASREAYEAWLKAQATASQKPPLPDVDLQDEEEKPYWEKRGMFWFGAGVKIGGMVGPGGYDWLLATMYNLEAPSSNKFILRASTRRAGWGAGGGAGAVIVFVTGIYSPNDLNKIRFEDWDWSLAIAGKWSGLLKWAAKAPALKALVNSARVAKYADYDLISKAASIVKASMDGYGLKPDRTEPSFVAMDIPIGGVGMEAAYYRGITSFTVSDVHLD